MKCKGFGIKRTSIIFAMVLSIGISFNAFSAKVCEAYYTLQPDLLNTKTIVLPDSAVALAPSVFVGKDSVVDIISDTVTIPADPPSIFFIIDHSSSMYGSNGEDPTGSRFTVTSALVDSIAKMYPTSEIGLVVFRGELFFDPRNNTLIKPYPVTSTNYGYLPLLKLDSSYGGQTGLQVIKQLLVTATNPNGNYIDLAYQRTDGMVSGTNITVGFRAAKDGFLSAKAPKERQFIIFLSDGESNEPDDEIVKNEYQLGINVPTTFTIYFDTSPNPQIDNLQTMTAKIKNNNYSVTNINTNIFVISPTFTTLLSLLLKEAFGVISTPVTTVKTPTRLTINTQTSSTYQSNTSSFVFPARFNFNPDNTPFTMTWFQEIKTDNGTTRSESKTVNFTIKREKGVGMPPNWALTCWERSLGFYFKGQPITAAIDTMHELTIRFSSDKVAEYPVVTVAASNIQAPRDAESFTLTAANGAWSKTFPSLISPAMVKNDGTFQHLGADSIVAVFRNPNLPLDTVRLAIPIVESNKIKITSIMTKDTSGNGFLDAIDVNLGTAFTLPANFDIANIQVKYEGPDGKVVFTPVTVTPLQNGNTLRITLREDSTTVKKQLQTGWTPIVTINGLDYFIETTQGRTAGDGAGPVVEQATLFSGNLGTKFDTIQVRFSEPINFTELNAAGGTNASKIFNFYNKDTLNNLMLQNATILNGNDTMVILLVPIGTKSVMPYQDYLQLVTGTHDKNLNTPPPVNLAREEQIITLGVNELTIIAVNNPVDLTNPDPLYIQVRDQINVRYPDLNPKGEDGALVRVITVKPLTPSEGESSISGKPTYGKAVVYDAVGNLVMDDLPIIKGPSYKDYGAFWNRLNRNGREVGSGTYLMVITVTDIEGKEYVQKTKIGVKK
jgi:hypothetical protein